MRNRFFSSIICLVLAGFVLSGCATAKPRRGDSNTAVQTNPQIAELQSQLSVKDQQIQDLQYQLEQRRSSDSNFSSSVSSGTSSKIHVSGVTVADVQRALTKAGFDPGQVDGKMGKKSKAAIKAFQRSQGLKADGVIGEKTWKLLRS